MRSYFIEVPVQLLSENPLFPDRDHRLIYEHLKYFCSKCKFLPAVDVTIVDRNLVVTSGHKYLRISRELGYSCIRAIYQSQTTDPVAVLHELPPGTQFIPRELLEKEHTTKGSSRLSRLLFRWSVNFARAREFPLRHRFLL